MTTRVLLAMALCGRRASGRPSYYMSAPHADGCFVQAGVQETYMGANRRGVDAEAAFSLTFYPDVSAGYTPRGEYTVTLNGTASGLGMIGGTTGSWHVVSSGSTSCDIAEQTGLYWNSGTQLSFTALWIAPAPGSGSVEIGGTWAMPGNTGTDTQQLTLTEADASDPTSAPASSSPVTPASSPTTLPTSSAPTTSPIVSPTTSDPSASPITSPTASQQSASPTISPTSSDPTTSPTASPTTSGPSESPTASSTASQSTASPTISPTSSNPTTSPTVSPTTSDTTTIATPATSPADAPIGAPNAGCAAIAAGRVLCLSNPACGFDGGAGGGCRAAICSDFIGNIVACQRRPTCRYAGGSCIDLDMSVSPSPAPTTNVPDASQLEADDGEGADAGVIVAVVVVVVLLLLAAIGVVFWKREAIGKWWRNCSGSAVYQINKHNTRMTIKRQSMKRATGAHPRPKDTVPNAAYTANDRLQPVPAVPADPEDPVVTTVNPDHEGVPIAAPPPGCDNYDNYITVADEDWPDPSAQAPTRVPPPPPPAAAASEPIAVGAPDAPTLSPANARRLGHPNPTSDRNGRPQSIILGEDGTFHPSSEPAAALPVEAI